MNELLHSIIGEDSGARILWWQMGIRAAMTFAYALLLIRLSGKRSFGKYTAFDIVISVMLGSTLSRALTGNAPIFTTYFAAGVLMLVHWLVARISYLVPRVGHVVKGRENLLAEDGHPITKHMKHSNITEHDLKEALREKGLEDLAQTKRVYIERNGEISVIKH